MGRSDESAGQREEGAECSGMECSQRGTVCGAAGGDRIRGDRCVEDEEFVGDERESMGVESLAESMGNGERRACGCFG